MTAYPTKKIDWDTWRIIPSRNPPIDLYHRIAPASDWPAVISVETLTNPRVREMREGLGLVRPEDMRGGATQNWNLAPFTYLNPEGTRHSDGTFGTCLLAKEFRTALLESIRLRERFLSRTVQDAIRLDMRVMKTPLSGHFDDSGKHQAFTDEKSRKEYWKSRHRDGSDGVYFRSPELFNGECVEAFRPRVMSKAVQERHLTYSWDGKSVYEIYDFREGKKIDVQQLKKNGPLVYVTPEAVGRMQTSG